jgi:hypothetical protein
VHLLLHATPGAESQVWFHGSSLPLLFHPMQVSHYILVNIVLNIQNPRTRSPYSSFDINIVTMDPNATDLETADLVLQTSLQEVEEALRSLDRDENDGRA